ncbi:hypothetical protein LTR85_011830 [Meristemomyces frigidus]|nr:hypothetical protein LTR85_011830 [Meristemomyces frigidus]
MGAEMSKEVAEASARNCDDDIEALKAKYEPAQRATYKALIDARDARRAKEAADAKQTAATMQATTAKKPELVRSSKSEAALKRVPRQPFIIESDDDEPELTQVHPASRAGGEGTSAGKKKATTTASDVLAAFQPRKQPRDKTSTVPDSEQSSSEDEFTGFGNTISTQQAASTPTATAAIAKAQAIGSTKPATTTSTSSGVTKQQNTGKLAALSTTKPTKQPVTSTPKAPSDFFRGAQQPDKVKATATETAKSAQPPSKMKLNPPPTVNTSVKASKLSKLPAGPASAVHTTTLPKRPAPSAFADERRTSAPKAPKRASAASPQSPDGAAPTLASTSKIPKKGARDTATAAKQTAKSVTAIGERPPKWYTDLKSANTRNPDEGNADGLLARLKADIKRCKGNHAVVEQLAEAIGEHMHKVAFERISGPLLRKNRILHNEDGLPQLFDQDHTGGVNYPEYVQADAEELYNKWCRHDFETDLLRGIIQGKPGTKKHNFEDKTTDKIDPSYEGRVSPKFHGNGLLLNGQWWPTQLTTVRDGAHGATIAGISGAEGEGAYSCIMSGGHDYPDEDHGNVVLYCGTDSNDGSVTGPTKRMLESEENGKPVRLIRSHNLKSEHAPEIGFRYDGLYKVVSSENMDTATHPRQRHRFKLVRLPGQAEIRSTGPAKRPTEQEKEAHKKDKRLRGYT